MSKIRIIKALSGLFCAEKLIIFTESILLILISIIANAWINSLSVHSEQRGRDSASRALAPVREHLHATLGRITVLQQSALLVDRAYRSDPADFARELDGLRKQITIAGAEVLHVGAADGEGNLKWSTSYQFDKSINIADREYFQKLSHSRNTNIISAPVIGKLFSNETLQFTTSLKDYVGKFQGIIFISIDTNLTRTLGKLIPDNEFGVVTIARSDGQVLSRSIDTPVHTLATDNGTVPFNIDRAITEGSSTFHRISPIDGTDRYFAVSHIPDWDAILLVGLEAKPEIMQLNEARNMVVLGAICCALISAVAAFGVIAVWRRRMKRSRIVTLSSDLERRESLLLQIAKNTTDMIVLMDADFRYIFINDAVLRTFGGDGAAWLSRRMGDNANHLPGLNDALATLAREGGSQRLLWDVCDSLGITHWIDLEIVAVDIRADDLVSQCCYYAVARDVTERVLAERQVMTSQRQIDKILQLGPGFFYEKHIAADGDVKVELPIASRDRLLGYSLAEVTIDGGFLLEQQTHQGDIEARKNAIKRCITDGRASVEFRATAKDGTLHWLLCQMQLIQHQGDQTDLIGFVTDITNEHAMRSRLRHSEQLATLGALAANIAHEMNQPLAVIALASENALRLMNLPDSSLPRITAKLEQIHIQVMRLSQVINSIRQFSRNEQSHMSEFTVKSVIDDALNLAEARIKSTGVTIGLQLPDNLPVLCMDRLLLERVLLNLIANACDAYGEQTSRALTHALDVIVSATLRESCLAIFVSDHAGGISTDLLDRLFDPFVTTKSGATGTGLGLSICAANIAELGGEITARNADGGAVFEIILPLESSVINV